MRVTLVSTGTLFSVLLQGEKGEPSTAAQGLKGEPGLPGLPGLMGPKVRGSTKAFFISWIPTSSCATLYDAAKIKRPKVHKNHC